jgi:hypothetical protein
VRIRFSQLHFSSIIRIHHMLYYYFILVSLLYLLCI